ncbi:disulfide bond formation protein B [Escherichia coli]|uniref:Disulfide bond formation protein B n=1 Tax=Escherichia coli TaxID=562 RepID=A0A376X167_ECOLX|nr:disulfide bond formation protein B [Escherichia coli]
MLRFLNQCSQGRGAWLLMAFTALALELTALWFQHVMLLKPCVLCIYERCALFGVLGAALIGAIAPKTPLRYVAMVIWLYSAFPRCAVNLRAHHASALSFAVCHL